MKGTLGLTFESPAEPDSYWGSADPLELLLLPLDLERSSEEPAAGTKWATRTAAFSGGLGAEAEATAEVGFKALVPRTAPVAALESAAPLLERGGPPELLLGAGALEATVGGGTPFTGRDAPAEEGARRAPVAAAAAVCCFVDSAARAAAPFEVVGLT